MKNLALSKRALTAPASPIRKLVPLSDAAKERGIKVYHLNIGDPDFSLPSEIHNDLKKISVTLNRLPYPAFRGQKNLLNAWQKYYKDIMIPFEIFHEDMIVTAGASDAMVLIAASLFDPDDDCLVFEPFYAPYQIYAKFTSFNFVPVSLMPDKGYHFPSKKEIVKKITSKTKAIFFTNPNNPTGTVFTKEEMQLILDIAKEYNLFIVSDETYRGMVFDNRETLSMMHLAQKDDLQRLIIADSLSKRLNVCGARMGLVLSKNQEFMDAAFRFTQGRPYAAYLEEEIVSTMLSDSLEYIRKLSLEYQKRRDAFISALTSRLDLKIVKPEGAFYLMLTLPVNDSEPFVKWMLTDFQHNNETVMLSPAAGFYATPGMGKNQIRVAYVLDKKNLSRAAELLALGLKAYKNIK